MSTAEVAKPTRTALILRCGRILLYSLPLADLFCPQTQRLKHIVTVNAEIFTYAHENRDLEKILAHTLNTVDGRVLQWLCSLLYWRWKIRRLAGSDFIYALAEYSATHSEGLLLLGASSESNRLAVEALRTRFPSLEVAGYSPPFCPDVRRPDWNEAILQQIETLRPTQLVVCFGPARQEIWISENAENLFRLGVRCAYGLGGTLDFVSGTKRRAPRWVQKAGAEWLFRLALEPRQRFLRTLAMFKMPYYAARTSCPEIHLIDPGSMNGPVWNVPAEGKAAQKRVLWAHPPHR